MTDEQEKAIESLTNSEQYISKKATETMITSIVSDFQWLLNIELYKIILKHIDKKDEFLSTIKDQWLKRAQNVLNSDLKRFQDTIIKATEDNKLKDNFSDILNNYIITQKNALNESEKIVDSLIGILTETKKETKNEN